jgi:hypothetical protein
VVLVVVVVVTELLPERVALELLGRVLLVETVVLFP